MVVRAKPTPHYIHQVWDKQFELLMPTEGESRSLARAPPRGRGSKLLPAEQWILAMVGAAPRMAAKAASLRFIVDFDSDLAHVSERLREVHACYAAVRASQPLSRLLEHVLALVNAMSGSPLPAKSIALSSLVQLSNARSAPAHMEAPSPLQ